MLLIYLLTSAPGPLPAFSLPLLYATQLAVGAERGVPAVLTVGAAPPGAVHYLQPLKIRSR